MNLIKKKTADVLMIAMPEKTKPGASWIEENEEAGKTALGEHGPVKKTEDRKMKYIFKKEIFHHFASMGMGLGE